MPSAQPTWKIIPKKLTYWFTPLLLVSIALHGLAMLLPVPEAAEEVVEEPEVELPEPIQVTELPKLTKPELEEVEQVQVYVPPPAPAPQPAPPPTPPVVTPPVVTPQPEPVFQEPVVQVPGPSSDPAPSGDPDPIPGDIDPIPGDSDPIPGDSESGDEVGSTVQLTYSSSGTREGDISKELTKFVSEILPKYPPLVFPEKIDRVFLIQDYYEDTCIPDETSAKGFLVIVVEDTGDVLASKVYGSTGYGPINDWVELVLTPNAILTPEMTAPDRDAVLSNMFGWLAENAEDTPFEEEAIEAYQFQFEVAVFGCEEGDL